MIAAVLLEFVKAACFFCCIASLYEAAIHALFFPGARWQERVLLGVLRLGFAAYVCFMSGLVFTLPLHSNPERGQPLSSTLPVRLFFWSAAVIVAAFLASWYLYDLGEQAAPFISSRTLQRF